jgi:hypothetical protein
MFSQKDVLYQQYRYQELMNTARRDRLAQRLSQNRAGVRKQVCSLLSGAGKQLTVIGHWLQTRYALS